MPLRDEKDIAPSDRELDILKVFWEIGEASVRDVFIRMSPNGEFAFTTIQTLIRIMAGKGLLSQRRDNRTLYYTPCYTAEQASSRFLHKLFDGSVDQLVMNMLRAENLSVGELKQLETLIAESRKRKEGRGMMEEG
ncbi:MAG: BlaI/MecI/CopY family transcriptional regulator [Planctomycetaceae bacterium]|nr:BlaI/MecI/CopY family transcriptional regulator [Planctomycetaceae bacterium]